MKAHQPLEGEKGSSIVIALIFLMLLTVIGMSATNTANIEIQMAGNDRIYTENLYLAEGAMMEAAQKLADAAADDILAPFNFDGLHGSGAEMADPAVTWDADGVADGNSHSALVDPASCRYSIRYDGLAPGSSLDMEETVIHQYTVYGRALRLGGESIIEAGYKRRM